MKEKSWRDDVGFEFKINKNFMCSRYYPGTTTHTATSRSVFKCISFY